MGHKLSWPRVLAAGALTGCVGVLVFGTVHAILIVPIWPRLLGGIPFGLVGGCAVAWAFRELRAAGRFSLALRHGVVFGSLVWFILLPMTAFGNALRVTGLRSAIGAGETVIEVILAGATGGLAGWWLARTRWATVAMAAAGVAMAAATAGPVPVVNSTRAALLFAGLLLVCLVAGVALVSALRVLGSPSAAAKQHRHATPGAV